MKRKIPSSLFYVSLLATGIACSSTNQASYQVEFDQDVKVVMANDEEKSVKQGESVPISDGAITVVREGSHPLILLPLPKEPGTMKLKLPKADRVEAAPVSATGRAESAQPLVDLNSLAQNILWIQNLILSEKPDDALTRIQDVRDRFKGLSYLRFLEASAYLAKGQVGRAQEICELALKDFPGDEIGTLFLRQITLLSGSSQARESGVP